jgi:pimeloyl-ACP methyl ester carboxylesterase
MQRRKFFSVLKWILIVYAGVGIVLYYLQDYILLHPKPLPANHTFSFSQAFKEENIALSKTDTLNLVKFAATGPVKKGVLIYFHGNKDNVEHYAPFVPAFTKHGYEVWMPDYPGFGKSTGEISEQKLYDIAYQVRTLAATNCPDDSIVIYGKSLGTALATYTAGLRPCRQLILETPYYSIPSLFRSYAFMYPARMLSNYKLPTYEFLQDVKAPVTIFHGTGDWVVPYRSGVRLKKFLKAGDLFVKIPDGSHNNLSESALYLSTLDSVLQKN